MSEKIEKIEKVEKMDKVDKKEQLLIITPANELKFRGPFNQAITSHMRLTNPTDQKILFKIKTTAPKKYCVRPNCGTLEPNNSVDVSICLQPFIYDEKEKNKHKFMVQSLIASDTEVPFEQQWKDILPTQLMDSKLRCVFEMPLENAKSSPSNKAPESATGDFIYNESHSLNAAQMTADLNETTESGSPDQAQITAEIKQLRSESLKLRMERVTLQEEIQRLRLNESEAARKGETHAFQNPYKPPQLSQASPVSPVYIIATLVIAIVAMLLGKFIL